MGSTKFFTLILPSPFLFFSSFCGNPPLLYCGITFGHVSCDRKALEDNSSQNSNSTVFRIYIVVLAIYAGVKFFVSFLLRIPACHSLTSRCDNWSVVRFIKWMHQVSHFLSDFFEGWSLFCALGWDVLLIIFCRFLVWRNTITLVGACMRKLLTSSSNSFIFAAFCINSMLCYVLLMMRVFHFPTTTSLKR